MNILKSVICLKYLMVRLKVLLKFVRKDETSFKKIFAKYDF